MYGLVNQALQQMIIEKSNEKTWSKVREKAGVNTDYFISHEGYDDQITYGLATAGAEVLEMPMTDFMMDFGRYWVMKTGKEKYGHLLTAGGSNIKEFLVNLPDFHNRVILLYPNLMPPEFTVSDVGENHLQMHYYSQRQGLHDFVKGLLLGIGDLFHKKISVEMISSRNEGADHEIYNLSWD